MLISQFMGRLARANRTDKSIDIKKNTHDGHNSKTDRQTQDTGVIGSIQFYGIQTFVSESV
jgi:hypothetical protein